MLKNMIASALFAGFATGVLVALLHTWLLEPLILEAELYEAGALVHFADVSRAMPDVAIEWDWARVAMNFVAVIAVYVAFALMAVAAFAFAETRGIRVSPRQGALWGIAGFASVALLPSMGLAPELPGMYAAELQPRQIWWFATVAASGGGIALLAFGRSWMIWAAGIVLILLPHIIGAPHPDAYGGIIPPELSAEFTSRTLGVSFAAWVLLGIFTAYFREKETG